MKLFTLFALGFIFGGTLQATEVVPSQNVKIVIFTPETHGDVVREAMGKAGAGKIGNYDSCSFSIKGVGRFRPLIGANPSIGEIGALEAVAEERIEAICSIDALDGIIAAIKKVHPYEEMGYDIYPLLDLK